MLINSTNTQYQNKTSFCRTVISKDFPPEIKRAFENLSSELELKTSGLLLELSPAIAATRYPDRRIGFDLSDAVRIEASKEDKTLWQSVKYFMRNNFLPSHGFMGLLPVDLKKIGEDSTAFENDLLQYAGNLMDKVQF